MICADVLWTPRTEEEEEETNLRDDQPTVVFIRCVICGEFLAQSNDENCSMTCIHNGKSRSYGTIAELAIMNVEYEIKRVAERYMDLINDYPKKAEQLVPCDIINGKIYRQMRSNKNQCNITIILHADGAPVVKVNNKSLWPIRATIAEISMPLRDWKSAVMLFGAWLASTKPPRSRVSYNVRVQQAIFDLPARAHFLNVVQYNGYDDCGDCCIKGTQAKCQERATQYSRSTGSEEVEIQPTNKDEDNDVDNNHMYTSKSFHDKDDNDYLPPTTDFISTNNGTKPTLDFSLTSGYKHNRNSGKHVISDDDDEIEEEETIHVTRGRSNTDCPKNTDDSPAAPLVIDEHSNVLSNVNGNLSDISGRISERDDDDDLVLPQVKPMKKKRKTASRPKQSTSNEALFTEVSNIHKEFLSFRYNIEKRIKSLEKNISYT
ncbi:unnamed protein product [Rotaria magnacalcarata]|uniref:Uncharacterized protein n=1 Tax=Rotaria magnacalcarata TaxID=392030 RepID=A0A819VME1_9BILA|nr:unnamed protein product [Rotaria magnacalcarata]